MKTLLRTLPAASLLLALILTVAASAPRIFGQEKKNASAPKSTPSPRARTSGNTRVGFVDVKTISSRTKFVQDLEAKIEKALEEKMKALEEKQSDYNRIRDELKRKAAVLSETEIESMGKESRRLFREIEEDDYTIQKYLDDARKKQVGPAIDRILGVVGEVAYQKGYDIILNRENIVYGHPSVDISDLVVKRLNSTYQPPKENQAKGTKKAPSISKE